MRGITLAVWLAMAFLGLPRFLAADTLDDLIAAALEGDERRLEAATTAAMVDKEFPLPKACAKAGELCARFAEAESDKKQQDNIMRAIRTVLTVTVDKSGDKEIPEVVPRLIEVVDQGNAQGNLQVEAALSNLTVHGFADADFKAEGKAFDSWADHKWMWTKWWGQNGTKPQKARIMGGFERMGVKLDFGNGDDEALDRMMQTLINALAHEQIYIRANAYRLLRGGCFGWLETPWGFDAEAPQASRQKAVEEARKLYADNKQAVFDSLRGKGRK